MKNKNKLIALLIFLGQYCLFNAQMSGTPIFPLKELKNMFGGTATELAYSSVKTSDGGHIAAGSTTSSNGDVTGHQGNQDFWVTKFDKKGNLQWQKTFGGSGDDQARSIITTSDGGYAITGNTSSNDGNISLNQGDYDYWVVKIDASGNLQWQKTYGGSGNDMAYSIIQSPDGTYAVTGQSSSNNGNVTGNLGGHDFWIVKLDNTGNILWEKSVGTSSTESSLSIINSSTNGFIVSGYTYPPNGFPDFFITKLSSAGVVEWQRTYGGSNTEICTQIISSSDGGYLATGYTDSNDGNITSNHGSYDFWLLKLDESGNIQWQKTYGGTGDDRAYSVIQTLDGGYAIGGSSTSNDGDVVSNHSLMDFWIVKVNNTGVIQWNKNIGGNGNDQCNSIIQEANGDYIVTGFSNSANREIARPVAGGTDFLVVRLSNAGEFKPYWDDSL
ncbi:T9SS C-terminal target domain-containing protein [Chryseobacterium binzhouense]|uniref:T9SS C-terminal target domain-containing protein n=1 Tax=Chryseobacterium binzhouense TaxID=2593646 RepID=UPI00289B12F9|nr:T9SS C-terminal target domain-containing protein [Chryseobacterium binzhouense]